MIAVIFEVWPADGRKEDYLDIAASLRAQAQYPAPTVMLTVGHCAATSIEILGVYALFHRFGTVGGWLFGKYRMRCTVPATTST